MHVISCYDAGVCCPYTVSLGTAVPLAKYGSEELRERFLGQLLRKDDSVWQGATWMTEIRGGSDLGAAVETPAGGEGGAMGVRGARKIFSEGGGGVVGGGAGPAGGGGGGGG